MSDVLKIMTCGSVDDGKSTLIGHLLFDAGMLFADQEKALELESMATTGQGTLDYSLLLDGLSSEREQGITIDVAYRYFATDKRSFIVADSPGHEEYTRNMAVAASSSELAIILIDASKGVLTQTGRHLRICSMMGIRDFVFAVNKMDSAGYSEEAFGRIRESVDALMADIPCSSMEMIPLSALKGDNITEKSDNMSWYTGWPLLEYLETVEISDRGEQGFVMPVQRVARADGYRGLQGNIASGTVSVGDEVRIYPGKLTTEISSINVAGQDAGSAAKGMAVTLEVAGDIDISRGRVLAAGTELICSNMFQGTLLWMDEKPLSAGRSYLLKLASQTVNATVVAIKYGIDPVSGARISKRSLGKNDIARVDIACHEKLVFDSFEKHQAMGRFILIDKLSNATAGAGTVAHPMRRAENLSLQTHDITREVRSEALGQVPKTVWFTGLSGSGKSALANELEKRLAAMGKHTMLLDGDNIRLGINKDLGFNDYDRTENIRRLAEIAKLMNDAGLIVITAFISPFAADREMAREIIGGEAFLEVHVSTPLEECERRDVKGLYRKARAGEIPNFTGVGSPYELPADPDVSIDTSGREAAEACDELMGKLKEMLEL